MIVVVGKYQITIARMKDDIARKEMTANREVWKVKTCCDDQITCDKGSKQKGGRKNALQTSICSLLVCRV